MNRKIGYYKRQNLELIEEVEYEDNHSDEFFDREAFMYSLEFDCPVVWLDVTNPYRYQDGSVA